MNVMINLTLESVFFHPSRYGIKIIKSMLSGDFVKTQSMALVTELLYK